MTSLLGSYPYFARYPEALWLPYEFERKAFRILMEPMGLAEMARQVLSVFTVEELVRVVADRDVAAMKQVPGIGAKKAEKILLDLSGKWPEVLVSGETSSLPASEASIEQEIILRSPRWGTKKSPQRKRPRRLSRPSVSIQNSPLWSGKPFARARRAGPSSLTQRGFSARSAPTPLEMRKATCNIKAG